MAVMAGAMMIHGIAPGPLLMNTHPSVFWGMVVSMWVGNLMLLVINLPLVGLWVKLLSVPYRMLFPVIIIFCAVGAYTMTNSPFNIIVMLVFGVIGFGLRSLRLEPAPLVLGFVLGPMMEENMRRAMLISARRSARLRRAPNQRFLSCLCRSHARHLHFAEHARTQGGNVR